MMAAEIESRLRAALARWRWTSATTAPGTPATRAPARAATFM